jgi:hypothetical protein
MQVISPYAKARAMLSIVTAALIILAVILELLPEDTSKVFVIPTLIGGLVSSLIQISIFRRN